MPGRPRFSFRSPLTYILLILLRSRPLPTHIIAYTLQERGNYVASYLSYLKKRGLVWQDNYSYWHISDLGLQLLFLYENTISNIKEIEETLEKYRTFITAKIIKKNARIMQEKFVKMQEKAKFSNTSNITNYSFTERTSFEKFLEKVEKRMGRDLSETEHAIVKYLWDYSLVTGRKYWWPPSRHLDLATALAEELRISSISSISEALRLLESKGIIYITYDKRKGIPKIRIDRSLEA